MLIVGMDGVCVVSQRWVECGHVGSEIGILDQIPKRDCWIGFVNQRNLLRSSSQPVWSWNGCVSELSEQHIRLLHLFKASVLCAVLLRFDLPMRTLPQKTSLSDVNTCVCDRVLVQYSVLLTCIIQSRNSVMCIWVLDQIFVWAKKIESKGAFQKYLFCHCGPFVVTIIFFLV